MVLRKKRLKKSWDFLAKENEEGESSYAGAKGL